MREHPLKNDASMNVETNRWLEGLNDRQREAVLAGDGPVLVVAGPGTGKTKTLTVRLAYLLAERHVAPEALLAMTFTTRAAREMRERLARLIGSQADRVFLGTFHSFCFQWLKTEGHRLGLPPDFGVADRRDQVTIMERALRRLGQPDTRTATQRKLHEVIAFRHRQVNTDERAEAAWIVGQIEESVGGTSHYQQYKGKMTDTVSQREQSFRDVAVLSRLHALTKPLQEALRNSGIPHRVVGETRFFDKSIVKDVLAYLRVIHNPHDDNSFAHVLNRREI